MDIKLALAWLSNASHYAPSTPPSLCHTNAFQQVILAEAAEQEK